jgi:predicted DNA-binding transcriptional regulator AlpA
MCSSTTALSTAPPTDPLSPRQLDAHQVGARLGCSSRHVIRMADRGAMPAGLKIGALRRWDAIQLDAWIGAGCQPIRQTRSA